LDSCTSHFGRKFWRKIHKNPIFILAENFEEKYTRIQFSFWPKFSSAISAKIMKILHTRIDPRRPSTPNTTWWVAHSTYLHTYAVHIYIHMPVHAYIHMPYMQIHTYAYIHSHTQYAHVYIHMPYMQMSSYRIRLVR
jgi:GR25 family glycosyltransferase involved in LPS biosynthesis